MSFNKGLSFSYEMLLMLENKSNSYFYLPPTFYGKLNLFSFQVILSPSVPPLLHNEALASSTLPDIFLVKTNFPLIKIPLEMFCKKRSKFEWVFLPFFSRWSNCIDRLCGFKVMAFQHVTCCYGAENHIRRLPFHDIFISDLRYTTCIANLLLAAHKHLHVLSFSFPLPLRMPIILCLQLLM